VTNKQTINASSCMYVFDVGAQSLRDIESSGGGTMLASEAPQLDSARDVALLDSGRDNYDIVPKAPLVYTDLEAEAEPPLPSSLRYTHLAPEDAPAAALSTSPSHYQDWSKSQKARCAKDELDDDHYVQVDVLQTLNDEHELMQASGK
jgi:hypothetical protein